MEITLQQNEFRRRHKKKIIFSVNQQNSSINYFDTNTFPVYE